MDQHQHAVPPFEKLTNIPEPVIPLLQVAIFECAIGGDAALVIFLAKTVLGLRELKETPSGIPMLPGQW